MTDMTVYIPTRGRADRQKTWSWLPPSVRAQTHLVTNETEAPLLRDRGFPVLVCPVEGIAPKRQWILDQHTGGDKILMLDDDLRFAARRDDEPTKFYQPEPAGDDMVHAFAELSELFETTAMAGFAHRGGANHKTEPVRHNERLSAAWGIRVSVARAVGLQIDRLPFMEDFDAALQLHAAGYGTALVNNYVWDCLESNASGGCASYRDGPAQAAAAMDLSMMWPDFVRTVEKKGWQGMGGTRIDVVVQWKRAYRAGVERCGEQEVPPTGLALL